MEMEHLNFGSNQIGEEMIIVRNQISQEEAKYSPRLFKK